MAESIIEITHCEVFCLRPDQPAQEALDELQRLKIHGAPVVDADGGPVGVVTMTDLVGDLRSATVGRRMSQPADVVPSHAPIRQVARTLVEQGRHHTVVVDRGKVVGFVSSVDVLAALVGTVPVRPTTFPPHRDAHGLCWSEPVDLRPERLVGLPEGPGFLALIHGGTFRRERVILIEAPFHLARRAEELVSGRCALPRELEAWWGWGSLRLTYAIHEGSEDTRCDVLDKLRQWQLKGEARAHELLGHGQMVEPFVET